ESGEVLGIQVSVWHENRHIVCIAEGQMGAYDPRPVGHRTLFTACSLTNSLLTIIILRLISQGKLRLTDCVSEWWDGFIRGDKRHVNVQQLLTHQTGMHNWLPSSLTLAQITHYKQMIKIAEAAPLKCTPGKCGHYPYCAVSWLWQHLVACVIKSPDVNRYLRHVCLPDFGLKHLQRQMFFPVPQRIVKEAKVAIDTNEAQLDDLPVLSRST